MRPCSCVKGSGNRGNFRWNFRIILKRKSLIIPSLYSASPVCVLPFQSPCIWIEIHDFEKTPPFDTMKQMVNRQPKAGADICKVVTTAQSFDDNLSVLRLISEFPEAKLVSFAMGPQGVISRVLCPLVGGDFTYASIAEGKESAPGQITVQELNRTYEMMRPNPSS